MSPIILLDGGMGQELLRRSSRAITPMWSADIMLNEPMLVRDLHREFINSGARVITLNTYTATPQRLKRENHLEQLALLHRLAMSAAQEAIDLAQCNDVQIAGCLPPLIASYRPDVSLSFEDSLATYRCLVELQSPASDLFICETMSSITEARAACTAALESGKPVWLALTVSDDNPEQLRSGESLKDALQALESFDTQATLLNCSQPEAISACWPLLSAKRERVGAYANGFVSVDSLYPGDTVETLEMRKDMSPQQYAEHAVSWAKRGASIIGGCCEIGPQHIKALHSRLCKEGYI
ncbi:homocysteine S-methyltransferase family protein [Brumicola pallidula]|jgi:S-methylmethionine-dependent homocysteine/selenocysteine methylase|uniref:Homocysteine S-methyltransferase n=1 Tax=Brumicola pallidula DSM 14239 = ACAM 615 TaxID=1121922 RepID=K6Z3A7_9ALTE|nr:homocysteine S-methyltransferase family protein [Glaciecola pallidula]GAC30721.1 homocysteine S-methyltransferase [Glaciecola pallidula DSM 14239 = ACAM 615]